MIFDVAKEAGAARNISPPDAEDARRLAPSDTFRARGWASASVRDRLGATSTSSAFRHVPWWLRRNKCRDCPKSARRPDPGPQGGADPPAEPTAGVLKAAPSLPFAR